MPTYSAFDFASRASQSESSSLTRILPPKRDPVRRGELIAAGGLLFDLLSRPTCMPARAALIAKPPRFEESRMI